MLAVIMAGGKGTRLSCVTNNMIPKPMVQVNGKPIIEWQIEALKKNNIFDIIVVIGYLHETIENYIGDGSRFGVRIQYIIEEEPLGTAGAFCFLKGKIKEDFVLVFGDVLFSICFQRMIEFHARHKALCTLAIHPNSHPFDSDLIELDPNSKVVGIDFKNNKRKYYRNLVNAGIYLFSYKILEEFHRPIKLDLEKDVLFPKIQQNLEVYGYLTSEYIRDVGTPDRLKKSEQDLMSGIVDEKNLMKKQKCVFLDRDGTVIKYIDLLSSVEQLELMDDAPEAIKLLHNAGYVVIIVTNQPVIARNLCSIECLNEIHAKLESLLGERGAYLDSIRYCPHHPDKGYLGENVEYKINCNCRKPKIGLLEECKKEFNIDYSKSWIIGDTTVDIQTGYNAGVHTALVKTGVAGRDNKYNKEPEIIGDTLLSVVKHILNRGYK